MLHDVFQALVDFAFAPEESLAILHPFEIADRDAAGIGQDVGDHENSLVIDDGIGGGGGGTVGAFAENAGLYAIGVLRGDLILDGRGNGDGAWLEEHILRRHFGAAGGKLRQRFALRVAPVDQLRYVEALLVVERAVNIRDADDFITRRVHEHGAHRADVPEALNDHARLIALHAEFGDSGVTNDHQPAASRFLTPARATQREGLAGDDGRGGVAHVHRVSVHDPSHGLLVGAEIGRGNVPLRPDELDNFSGIAARDALDLALGKFRRIADDATLRAAERNVNDSAFPRHPGRKCANFVERYVGCEADAALAWTAHDRMVHAVAYEDLHVPVIESYRNVDGDFLIGVLHVTV